MSNKKLNSAPQDDRGNTVRLDDESRVKVLSPSMLVLKRFVRNRLAITGLVILIVMFVFSFLGGYLMPYSQTQVFRKYEAIPKDFASAVVNNELRYVVAPGAEFPSAARSQFILAQGKGQATFMAGGVEYAWLEAGEDFYRFTTNEILGTALGLRGNFIYTPAAGMELTPEVTAAFEAAQAAGEQRFEVNGDMYFVTKTGKNLSISRAQDIAIGSKRIFDAYAKENSALVAGFPFRLAALTAIAEGEKTFTLEDATYELEAEGDAVTVYAASGTERTPFAMISLMITSPSAPDVFLTVPFKDAVSDAIREGKTSFTFAEADGTEIEYTVSRTKGGYTIKRDTVTQLIDMYASPTKDHLLGTDGNGMDMMTRLMYGGRISLMVGFVVVLIELVIGVIIGGVAGYFGGWIDTLLMRFIDLFNCIPYWPVMLIIGAVMDSFQVDPTVRIFLLMLVLGALGWTSIARVVRGQILSLREQDFMVATEATGIRVSRRIFKHLVPNVMPLLIVNATMNLGGIIITEATLSFLGLGLKYPMASWGSIINAASDVYVMTNYWFIWIPAGLLILLTVLGFNFVGDGLRDAFDPKMKR